MLKEEEEVYSSWVMFYILFPVNIQFKQ